MLKIGDRVRVVEIPRGIATSNMLNKTATVRMIKSGHCGLEFDEHVHGHDLDGSVTYGYGYFVLQSEVVAYNEVVTGVLTIGDI